MGEAKRRGTFEERREQGIAKRKAGILSALVDMPDQALGDLYLHNKVMEAFMAKPEADSKGEQHGQR